MMRQFLMWCCLLLTTAVAANDYRAIDYGARADGPTPAYGLFARHVDGLMLRNVRFELMRPDERPDIILDDVTNHSIQQ